MHIIAVEAAYHFSWPLWGWLSKKWGNIPITRRNLPKAIKSLEKARKVVESGTSIVLLPEGHRTLSGEIGEFKKGPFYLAMEAKADILPFAMSGLFEFKRKYDWTLNPTTIYVIFGKPITFESFKDQSIDEIREKVRNTIVAIKQQSKVHTHK
jgi:1-acyl-sn-glycerol-3-phosphate acyltransferase